MKILFAARMARWDLLRATQSLASRVTKWSKDCDAALHRLVCYINSSLDVRMQGFIGDRINECKLWLFSDEIGLGSMIANRPQAARCIWSAQTPTTLLMHSPRNKPSLRCPARRVRSSVLTTVFVLRVFPA